MTDNRTALLEMAEKGGDVDFLRVPEVDIHRITPEAFHETCLAPNTPVVFRGMATDWEAVRNWSPEFFAEHYGNALV